MFITFVGLMTEYRLERLIAFLKAIEKIGGKRFTIRTFHDRLWLQKIVYIAKHFGINLEYNYSLYIRGPYSKELADDYYTIEREFGEDLPNIEDPSIEISTLKKLWDFVKERDIGELELIATILMIESKYGALLRSISPSERDKLLIKAIKSIKPYFTEEKISKALNELREWELIN